MKALTWAGNSAGALYDLYPPSAEKVLHPAGEFNHVRIVMRDGLVKHYQNGVKLLEADLNGEEWRSRVQASKFRAWENFGVHRVDNQLVRDVVKEAGDVRVKRDTVNCFVQ